MLKTLQVVGLSSLTGLAVLSFVDTAAAQLNVNVNLGGSRQPRMWCPVPLANPSMWCLPLKHNPCMWYSQEWLVFRQPPRDRAITAKSPIAINRSM